MGLSSSLREVLLRLVLQVSSVTGLPVWESGAWLMMFRTAVFAFSAAFMWFTT